MFRKLIFVSLTFTSLLTACLPVGQIQVDIETPTGEQSPTESLGTEVVPLSTETPTVSATEIPLPSGSGTVTGKVCYPSERIPPLYAYFRNVSTGMLTEFSIAENQSEYSFELPAGTYETFAYLQSGEGGGGSYSMAVQCGLTVECTDHSLIAFEVLPGQTTSNVDLCDWYDPASVPVNPKASIVADPALAGLVYQNLAANSLWRVNADGQAVPILAWGDMNTVVSPDGTQAIFFKSDDVWIADLTTGNWRNLTQTPERVEYPAFWVPGTDLIGMSSYNPAESSGLPAWQLTFVRLDGSGYEVVDQGAMWGSPAVSPDGTTVAYDVDGEPRLYRIGSGVEGFDPAQHGLANFDKFSAPAFSPDGTKLAWWVGGSVNGETQVALAVRDLVADTVALLHVYTPISGEGFFNPVWSPDGQWLAAIVVGETSRSALWVFKADGNEEHLIGDGAEPVWSPESNALLFIQWTGGPAWEGVLNRVVLSDWSTSPVALPAGSLPLAWMSNN